MWVPDAMDDLSNKQGPKPGGRGNIHAPALLPCRRPPRRPGCRAARGRSGPVRADPVRLRVADSFPADHYLARLVLKPWMDEVSRRTNGAVVFTRYPNQQLGKAADLLRLTQAGVVDIGYVAPSYVSDKMPVSEVAQVPGQFDAVCPGTMAY